MKTPPIAIVVTGLLTAPALADTLYDNGPPNGDNGYSNTTEGVLGFRRTLLDDFVVPEGESWRITGFHWEHIWGGNGIWRGWNLEILFRSDAGSAPGDPVTGLANITNRMEILAPANEGMIVLDPASMYPP